MTPAPPVITDEQDAQIRTLVFRHVLNMVEEMAARTDIVPHIKMLSRGIVGLHVMCYIAAHSVGNTLGQTGTSKEQAETALAHLVDTFSAQFALGHVAGTLAATQEQNVPNVPPA